MIQFSSVTQLFMTLCDPKDCSTYIINSRSLLKLMSIELVMLFNHLILCHPLLLLPSILSSIRSFQMNQFLASGGQIIGVSASASVLPMNIQDWFPLEGLVVSPCSPRDSQESSPISQFKTSILWCSAFFIVQFSHPYMTTGKTIELTRQTFVGKVMDIIVVK